MSQNILLRATGDDAVACRSTVVNLKYRPVNLQSGDVVPLGDWVIQSSSRFVQYVLIEAPGIDDIPASPGVYEFKMKVTDCKEQIINQGTFWGKRYYFQVD